MINQQRCKNDTLSYILIFFESIKIISFKIYINKYYSVQTKGNTILNDFSLLNSKNKIMIEKTKLILQCSLNLFKFLCFELK